MITALDTNVLVALWDRDDKWSSTSEDALMSAQARGKIVISGVVYAELMAFPRRKDTFIDQFLTETGVGVEWAIHESMWRLAGAAYQTYASRRRRHPGGAPRRLLADFLIGAHVQEKDYSLLTFDDRIYRIAFPKLKIVDF